MIHIAICDDVLISMQFNETLVKNIMKSHQIPATIKLYNSSENLLFDIQERIYFDLFILDIEMPKVDGLEVARNIRDLGLNSLIIFISTHERFVFDSMKHEAFRFIPKDRLKEHIEDAMLDAVKKINNMIEASYLIKTTSRYERIQYKEILYIKKDGKNSLIYTIRGSTHERKSINAIFESLNSSEFCFIDRGCIVNITHVAKLDSLTIHMIDDTVLYVSKQRINEVRKYMNRYYGRLL